MVEPIQFVDDDERAIWDHMRVLTNADRADDMLRERRARSTRLIHRGTRAVSRDAIVASIAAGGVTLSAEQGAIVGDAVFRVFEGEAK